MNHFDTTFQKALELSSIIHKFHESILNQTHVSTTLTLHILSNQFHNSNIVFSPLSFHVVLSVLAAASKGETHDEILDFLNANTTDDLNNLYSQLVSSILADGSPNGGPRLNFVNGIWVDKDLTLKPCFKHLLETVYKITCCNQVDFKNKAEEITEEVNLWVTKETNGLITHVLSGEAISSLTRYIFANAIYFKGSWTQKFEQSKTKKYDFHLLDGNKVQVPFMTSKKHQCVREYDDFKVLGLPYIQGDNVHQFTMYFYLPNAKNGLPSLVEKIGSNSDFFKRYVPMCEVEVGLFLLPKFKISSWFEASDMLKDAGLVSLDGVGLTEMFVGQSPYVASKFVHKSFIEVNEEGTKVAATLLNIGYGGSPPIPVEKPKPVDFVANHPFLFVIREDNTGVVLFVGQVIDPSVDGNVS
ncbi:hypothetical protein QVD17_39139 [Tagetes erecta]|uniref:Serpin domain-containing protein n=1 Tax=Tagetes erecta TaxID=13708 RepID=A0AAD8NGU2_TARER|nr:hypothetical protein QVD17_39139 [Tagetes erecta]